MELNCLLEYTGKAYYEASLAEPMSCSIGAFDAAYHTQMGVYTHEMGIKEGGKIAIMAGAGPMGLGVLTYALHRDIRPSMVVVTDVNTDRLARAEELFPIAEAEKNGIELHFVNMNDYEDPMAELRNISDGTGYDDVFCYAPVAAVIQQSSAVLGRDGYLDSAAHTTLNLPKIPRGKKLIYTHLSMGVAIPHGTTQAKGTVKKSGIVFFQYPEGVDFGDKKAQLVFGFAGVGDEHLDLLANLCTVLEDEARLETLKTSIGRTIPP